RISILIDGHLVAASGVEGMTLPPDAPTPQLPLPGFPVTVKLTAGEHDIDVRFQAGGDNAMLELYWAVPGKEMQIIPPDALVPVDGGVWTTDERPGLGSPDPSVLGAIGTQKVSVAGTIDAQVGWAEARGVGSLLDGKVLVA